MKRCSLCVFIILLIWTLSLPENSYGFKKVGKAGMQFLKLGVGARATGMGGAFIASVDDINSMFWNPAGITRIDNQEVMFHYQNWVADISHMAGAYAINLGSLGTFGISAVWVDYGDIEITRITNITPEGQTLPNDVITITGDLTTATDIALGVAYARQMTDKFSMGGHIRYVQEKLAGYKANVLSFDFGSLYLTGFRSLRIAMTAQNFAPETKFDIPGANNFRLPLVFKIALAMELWGEQGAPYRVTGNFDAIHPNDYEERLHFGAELALREMLFVRGGYKVNYDNESFSFGAGANFKTGNGYGLTVDYAFAPLEFLENVHRFSLSLKF